jgi:hypothetical protein
VLLHAALHDGKNKVLHDGKNKVLHDGKNKVQTFIFGVEAVISRSRPGEGDERPRGKLLVLRRSRFEITTAQPAMMLHAD